MLLVPSTNMTLKNILGNLIGPLVVVGALGEPGARADSPSVPILPPSLPNRTPVTVPTMQRQPPRLLVGALAGGHDHTCFLSGSGQLSCWGADSAGQLLTGNTTDSSVPVPPALMATGATAVAAGWWFTCAALSNAGVPAPASSKGRVQCFGADSQGQLGGGRGTASSSNIQNWFSTTVTAVSAGASHACALLSDGTVQCWGANNTGQLGNGSTTSSTSPVAVTGLSGVKAIAAGADNTCALLSGGTVQCWGGTAARGGGSSSPTAVAGLSGVVAVANGTNPCALLSNGIVECWGDNTFGQLCNGTTTSSASPVQVPGITTAKAIASGGGDICAILAGGGVECWGKNDLGELGTATRSNSSVPLAINGLGGAAVAIGAGFSHVCVQLATGAVQCWGKGVSGELGNGSTPVFSASPVTVIAHPAWPDPAGASRAPPLR
jgi:alpha-tubulin suppressor-like RCC1 family protein